MATRGDRSRLSALGILLLAASGCATPPPPPAPRARQELVVPLGTSQTRPATAAVVPLRVPQGTGVVVPDPAAAPSGGTAPPAFAPRLDGARLQVDLARAVTGTGLFGDRVAVLPAPGLEDDVLALAERAGAQLAIDLEVASCVVRFDHDDGVAWWASVVTFVIAGPAFDWWIPDEVYEARLAGTLRVLDVRSGEAVLEAPLDCAVRASLNDLEHGYHLFSQFRVPYSLDVSNWEAVDGELRQALEAELLRTVQGLLVEQLPARLGTPEAQRVLREGNPERGRTFALVVGCDGPPGQHRLRHTEADARAVAALLQRWGCAPEDLVLLVGRGATRDALVRAVHKELRPRVVGSDRVVVYFAGFGVTAQGERGTLEALVLADTEPAALGQTAFALADLSALLGELLAHEVTVVLDASFGGSGGRTFPGGVQPPAGTYLQAVGDASRGLAALAAASPDQAAFEVTSDRTEEQHGIFTFFHLQADDRDGDGVLSLADALATVEGQVPAAAAAFWGRPQEPWRLGGAGTLGSRTDD